MKFKITVLLFIILTFLYQNCDELNKDQFTGQSFIVVTKHDQSVQCNPNSEVVLDTMSLELTSQGIDVLGGFKRWPAHVAVIAVCGASTLNYNAYIIKAEDVSLAEELGFSRVDLEQHSERNCPQVHDPICGSNGKDYSNLCLAIVDQVYEYTHGFCSTEQ